MHVEIGRPVARGAGGSTPLGGGTVPLVVGETVGGTEAVVVGDGEVDVVGDVGDVVLVLELGVPTSPPMGISVERLHASRQTKGRAKDANTEARYAVFKRLSVDAADEARLDGTADTREEPARFKG